MCIRDRCIRVIMEGGVAVNKVKFILGEDKHVKLLIRSPNDEPFTILSAHYSLLRYGEAEASGECEICLLYTSKDPK